MRQMPIPGAIEPGGGRMKTLGPFLAEWGRGFEHGFSQIVDWFWKLDDQSRTNEFRNRFGAPDARLSEMLVIGRNGFLPQRDAGQPEESQRADARDAGDGVTILR